ncbi:transglutaminase domain-containing protein [Streptomyces griseorubiginosus]|uniref:transglutaminase-like domain-containing protein n=1 Tax=Streptomyces griseorubiginosus TaxID=67304 RepID=UPI002E80D667|nr:transglutaminase domain-containing protein [Streptomyces griseorubiginosus]WUB45118.1 transglutaminase domain-containing protein [Streptomyces griseorubiginosus]WUB53635.1 transglutaminase domain-containing protein [Streptomyces griseorubiginosus]
MSLSFYATQSVFSDPGHMAPLYDELPPDPAELARIVRDVMIHRVEGELFGHTHPTDRLHDDAESRYIDDVLRILAERSAAPLTVRREPGDRFVGVCRDFTLLHVSLLRHAGVPARLRSGFADYFGTDGFHCDHVVTEYWTEGRGWLLADAQLADPAITAHWPVDFDPMDVPRSRFLVAGEAWRAIREDGADETEFGLHRPEVGPLFGERFVAGNVRLDLAALNKVETLLWDVWGADDGEPGTPLPRGVRELYDRVAPVVSGEVSFEAVRKVFAEEDGVRTPSVVTCYAPFNGTSPVTLR